MRFIIHPIHSRVALWLSTLVTTWSNHIVESLWKSNSSDIIRLISYQPESLGLTIWNHLEPLGTIWIVEPLWYPDRPFRSSRWTQPLHQKCQIEKRLPGFLLNFDQSKRWNAIDALTRPKFESSPSDQFHISIDAESRNFVDENSFSGFFDHDDHDKFLLEIIFVNYHWKLKRIIGIIRNLSELPLEIIESHHFVVLATCKLTGTKMIKIVLGYFIFFCLLNLARAVSRALSFYNEDLR